MLPQKQQQSEQEEKSSGETLHWKDAARKKQRRGSKQDSSLGRKYVTQSIYHN